MKKILVLVFVSLLLQLSLASSPRLTTSFNNNWKFHLGDISNAQSIDYDDANWRMLNVPHDWAIELKPDKNNSHRNGWFPGGIGWYRKSFELTKEDIQKHIEIQFDGIYCNSQIWVNGKLVGKQFDGYTSFYFDITDFVHFDKPNQIAIRVDNEKQPNTRWYSGAGIYRNVWLRKTNKLHIQNWGTSITTPAVTKSEAVVNVVTSIRSVKPRINCDLQTTLYDANGKQVAQYSSKVDVSNRRSADVEHELSVYSPQLWSVESPAMYRAISQLIEKGSVVDEYTSSFGIRTICFDAKKGFSLNGKGMKLKGVCLHHETATLGAAVPIQIWERRLENLKKVGCNAIRIAHKPMPAEFLDLCDNMGFLVMDEFVDKWDHPEFANPAFLSEWKKNFGETIRRDRNHPSVIIWSVGNENNAPGSQLQKIRLEEFCNFVRSIDNTRPVVSGMLRGQDMDPDEKVDKIIETTQHMDIIGMNYGDQWVDRLMHRNPGKCFVSTESNNYYSSTETERWSLTEKSPWFFVEANEAHIGQFLWVGVEYLGEVPAQGLESYPNILCWASAFLNSAGFRNPLSYQFQALWTEEPMVWCGVYDSEKEFKPQWGAPPIMTHWNLREDKAYDIVTYTNCDYVELYVNNKRLGIQKLSDFSNWIMNWREIGFEAGEIKAVGIIDGKAVCEHVIKTADKPAQISLTADKASSKNDDIIQVEIQLKDKNANKVFHQDVDLIFDIKGAEIIGLDNGDLSALDKIRDTKKRKTYNGKCLAIIRVNKDSDAVVLNVGSNNIKASSLKIDIER